MGEIEKVSGFFEGSWVGQFRAVDLERARLFGRFIAEIMEREGVQDVGFSIREGSAGEFSDETARITFSDPVPREIFPESVPHEEVQRQLKERRRGDDDD